MGVRGLECEDYCTDTEEWPFDTESRRPERERYSYNRKRTLTPTAYL